MQSVGNINAAALTLSACYKDQKTSGYQAEIKRRYIRLDEILKRPVLKRELFTTPVMLETLELLRYGNSFLCRVSSSDGAEGISVGHSELQTLFPIFIRKLQSFFIGKDARDLDYLIERVHIYNLNCRLVGIALGVPLATIEFAILDMLGRIAGKSMGEQIGDIHNPEVGIYIESVHNIRHFEIIFLKPIRFRPLVYNYS